MTKRNHVQTAGKSKTRNKLIRRDWLKLNGDYLLSWALTAPNDLQSSILTGELDEDQLVQANALIECLQTLNPPRRDPSKWRFLIQLGENRSFLDFRIVRDDVMATRVGEYRSKTLSLIPRDWYSDGYDRLVEKFHLEFFGHEPSLAEMEQFILDPGISEMDYGSALDSSECRGPQINY